MKVLIITLGVFASISASAQFNKADLTKKTKSAQVQTSESIKKIETKATELKEKHLTDIDTKEIEAKAEALKTTATEKIENKVNDTKDATTTLVDKKTNDAGDSLKTIKNEVTEKAEANSEPVENHKEDVNTNFDDNRAKAAKEAINKSATKAENSIAESEEKMTQSENKIQDAFDKIETLKAEGKLTPEEYTDKLAKIEAAKTALQGLKTQIATQKENLKGASSLLGH